jgi:hypothetical protein
MTSQAAVRLFALIISTSLAAPALSAEFMDTEARHEVTLDLNADGVMDRAVLDQGEDGLELSITMSKNGIAPDAAAKPDFLRPAIGAGVVSGLAKGEAGELLLAYGCGGCSNDVTSMLSIVLKDGNYLVSRYQQDWDTREGAGQCIIDYLANTGELTIDVEGKTMQLQGPFEIKTLSEWDETLQEEACGG